MALQQNQQAEPIARMFAAISRGDMDEFRACFTANAKVWHADDELAKDLDTVCVGLSGLHAASKEDSVAYTEQRIAQCEDTFFVQHVLKAELMSGATLRLPAMMRIDTDGHGLITRIEEYYDSRATDILS